MYYIKLTNFFLFFYSYVSVFDHNLKGKVKTNKYLIKSAIDKDRQEIFQIFDFITQKEFETKDKKPEKTSDNGMEEEELPKEEAENQNNQEKFEKFVLNVFFFMNLNSIKTFFFKSERIQF